MSRSNCAISVSALKKNYHEKEVLKNVSFSVPPGTIYALLGSTARAKRPPSASLQHRSWQTAETLPSLDMMSCAIRKRYGKPSA